MGADARRNGSGRFEFIALVGAVIALGSASGMTWKTLDAARPVDSTWTSTEDWTGQISEPNPATVEPDWPAGAGLSFTVPPPVPSRPAVRILRPLPAWSPPPTEPTFLVGVEEGRVEVARRHGSADSPAVMLPDGRLGWPNGLVPTDRPFRPFTADEMADRLSRGEFRHFSLHRTDHYLIFYSSSPEFARESGRMLESLYAGLLKTAADLGLPARDAEFPLVAVAFRNETEYREYHDVAPDDQATYDVVSNRIYFFESRDQAVESPELASRRKPQTIGHEGTHQVLMNIGVQSRLAAWPAWLVEGLAEYCSHGPTKDGQWAGAGLVNPVHVATLREMKDLSATSNKNSKASRQKLGLPRPECSVRALLGRDSLNPTDYALAWGLTHYLARKRPAEFSAYLRALNARGFEAADREAEIALFESIFGHDHVALSQAVDRQIASFKKSETLPYYAVAFEQGMADGSIRRGTIVSQSPLLVRQWVERMAAGSDSPYHLTAICSATRAAAFAAAEKWGPAP